MNIYECISYVHMYMIFVCIYATLAQAYSHKLQSFTLSSSVIISLCHFDKILEVNPETKIARFQGGVVIHKLAEGEYIISMP